MHKKESWRRQKKKSHYRNGSKHFWLTGRLTGRLRNELPNSTQPCSRMLEKLAAPQLVKKFPAFYGNWKFITVFTTARHLSLSWARSIQSTPTQPFLQHPYLILVYHLRLGFPSGLFRIPHQNPMHLSSTPYVPYAQPQNLLGVQPNLT